MSVRRRRLSSCSSISRRLRTRRLSRRRTRRASGSSSSRARSRACSPSSISTAGRDFRRSRRSESVIGASAGRRARCDHPQRPWFYHRFPHTAILLGARAQLRRCAQFDHLPGQEADLPRLSAGLRQQLRAMLKGVKSIAVEYSAKRRGAERVARVDAGNARADPAPIQVSPRPRRRAAPRRSGRRRLHRALRRRPSHRRVCKTKRLRVRDRALSTGRIKRSASTRSSRRSPPRHDDARARGSTAGGRCRQDQYLADPYYVPTAARTAQIQQGDLIVIPACGESRRCRKASTPHRRGVRSADKTILDKIANAFQTISLARDQAMVLITDRERSIGRAGAEVDQATRAFIKKVSLVDQVMHFAYRSPDRQRPPGGGADLDDFEVTHDTRIPTPGTGFTRSARASYFPAQSGSARTAVSVYLLAKTGPEITTPCARRRSKRC